VLIVVIGVFGVLIVVVSVFRAHRRLIGNFFLCSWLGNSRCRCVGGWLCGGGGFLRRRGVTATSGQGQYQGENCR
jgi:hypothetical protein